VSSKSTRRAPVAGTALRVAVAACTACLISLSALAQTAAPDTAVGASATKDPTVKELQNEIRKRDALIESLARRVERLERQVNRQAAKSAAARANVVPAVASPSAPGPAATNVSFGPEQTAQAPPPGAAPPAPAPAAPSATTPAAPGQFEVSPEAAERALERTLVATGNLLVPAGFAEVEPLFSYDRRETTTEVIANLNRNELSTALDTRIGLPWESQLEVALPWNFDEQQVTNQEVAPAQLLSDRWGNSVGDLTIGAAKTFIYESGWIPSILGRVTWEVPTGPIEANGVPLNSGANRLSASLTALRRQDPLVFTATGGYTRAFEANGLIPGNQINFTTGAFLATSPETSLRAVLSQNFVQDVTIHGVTIPGSNSVQPIMTFGASSILGRGLLVDLQVGLGLTNAAPKYQVVLSSTYRFGVTGH
jgi:hypothetical protein